MSVLPTKNDQYYDLHIFCCTNIRPEGHKRGSCGRAGSAKLRDYMKSQVKKLGLKARIRVNSSACLDRCELGPIMVIYPEGIWYSYQTEADVDEIIQTHICQGKSVDRLIRHKDE